MIYPFKSNTHYKINMIPKIKKIKNNKYPYNQGTYMIIGNHGIDLVDTYLDAIRCWLWHCGVPARYCFKKWKIK